MKRSMEQDAQRPLTAASKNKSLSFCIEKLKCVALFNERCSVCCKICLFVDKTGTKYHYTLS